MRRIFATAAVLLAGASLFAGAYSGHGHGHGYWWDRIPGFFIVFGFLGCAGLILFSKWLGRIWLYRGKSEKNDD